jgi:small-conductance mechanosensitive channel
MLDVYPLLERLPDGPLVVNGLLLLALYLAMATAMRRLLMDDAAVARLLPPEPRGILRRWVPNLFVAVGVLAGLDVAGALPVREVVSLVYRAVHFPLLHVTDTDVTFVSLCLFGVVLLLTRRVSGWVQDAVGRVLNAQEGADEGMTASLQQLANYAVLATGLVVALQTAGFNLSALLAASAVLGVGIAFGLQTISENFVAGLILLFERRIRPGDMIGVEGRIVRITQMGIRSTTALSMEDERIVVPNAILVRETVVNHSTPTPVVRARASVGVAYDSDVDEVLELLREAADSLDELHPSKDPVVLLTDFGDNAIGFEVSIWVDHAFVRPLVLSNLRVAIWRVLKCAEVEIAFPQLDVHFDSDAVAAMQGRRGDP